VANLNRKLVARPVVANKFWTVADGDRQVASIIQGPQGWSWLENQTRQRYQNRRTLQSTHSVQWNTTAAPAPNEPEMQAMGYSTHVIPHNVVWDTRLRAPLYTPTLHSHCRYAAGYYVVRGQVLFCPKVIVLNRNTYQGPYQTQQQAVHVQSSTQSQSQQIRRPRANHESKSK
jgi:hypothetical protein